MDLEFSDIKYCSKCIISNQRPSSVVEFKNKSEDIEKRDMRIELEGLKRMKQQMDKDNAVLQKHIIELKEKIVSLKRENIKLEEQNLDLYKEQHPSDDEFEDAEE